MLLVSTHKTKSKWLVLGDQNTHSDDHNNNWIPNEGNFQRMVVNLYEQLYEGNPFVTNTTFHGISESHLTMLVASISLKETRNAFLSIGN